MVGIIILNYNTWEESKECIKSIVRSKPQTAFTIYLVDNNSPVTCDACYLAFLDESNVVFIANKENRGYAAGNNVGIKRALQDGCDAIVVCNSDILFNEGTIDGLYERLFKDEKIGIIGPQVLYKGNPDHITRYCKTEFPQKYFGTTFLRHLYPKINQRYYGLDLPENEERYCHDVSGCCFMLKNTCARQITPLDEHTFLFEEELIMGIRCSESGYKVLYYPYVNVIHNHSGSTSKSASFSYIKGTMSEIYYCRRYLNANSLQIFPLYLIRVMSYIRRMLTDAGYRRAFGKYLTTTLKGFRMPIEKFNS